jgi:hypothetical protein
MKPKKCDIICFVGSLALIGAAQVVLADAKANPYQGIVERNAFGLKPPPPPQSDAPPPPPAAPLAKVTLTGITSMFGQSSKRALLEIIEQEPGKAGNPRKPILREGERDGSVEVLSIDVERNLVTIRNGPVETNITFEVQKSAPTTPGLPVLAAASPPALTSPVPSPPNMGSSPTIITRDGGLNPSGGSTVTIIGANSTPTTPTGIPLASSTPYGGTATAAYGAGAAANTAFGSAQGGLKIPSRPVRTETASLGHEQPPLPRDQQAVLIELNRELNRGNPKFPPLPPTQLNPTGE